MKKSHIAVFFLVGAIIFSSFASANVFSDAWHWLKEKLGIPQRPLLSPGESKFEIDRSSSGGGDGGGETAGRDILPVGNGVGVNAPDAPVTHLACEGSQCVSVAGAGADGCASNSDCVVVEESHLECVNEQCVSVAGSGTDECSADSECVSATIEECDDSDAGISSPDGKNHFVAGRVTVGEDSIYADRCSGNFVIEYFCVSNAMRSTTFDCASLGNYVCSFGKCVVNNAILENSNAGQMHTECRDARCVAVSGPGTNECDTDECASLVAPPALSENSQQGENAELNNPDNLPAEDKKEIGIIRRLIEIIKRVLKIY